VIAPPGAGMMWLAINVYRHREGRPAACHAPAVCFSIFYLFALFATLLLEVVVRAVAPVIRAVAPAIGAIASAIG
jgi:protoheme IX farnesyltransferase